MRIAITLLTLLSSAPAFAQSASETVASVSEPSNLALVMIGLAGLVIGRQAAKRSRKKGPDQDSTLEQ